MPGTTSAIVESTAAEEARPWSIPATRLRSDAADLPPAEHRPLALHGRYLTNLPPPGRGLAGPFTEPPDARPGIGGSWCPRTSTGFGPGRTPLGHTGHCPGIPTRTLWPELDVRVSQS